MARNWQDTRSRLNLDETEVAKHKERMFAEIQTYLQSAGPVSPKEPDNINADRY
jgi:hypothetical protein